MKTFTDLGKATVMALLCTTALAQADQLDDIKAKGELTCATLGVTRGMSFIDPATRQLAGYEVELCNAIAEKLGVKPVMRTLAAAARIPELQAGRTDLVLAELSITEERAKAVDFSTPYYVTRTTIMVRKDEGSGSFADLAGKKIATTKGSIAEELIREQIPTADIISFDTTAQAFLAFTQGKVAGYATDETSLFSSRAQLGAKGADMVVLDEALDHDRIGAGIRKDEAALLETVNEVLAELEASGEAEDMFLKWFGPETDVGYTQRKFRIDGAD